MIISPILSEIVADQCMKLTSTVLSKYDFDDLSHPLHEYWCPFESFAIRFEDLFGKELVELSVLARVNLDVDDALGSKVVVGSLTEEGQQANLTFRQACNKIIHAKTCEIEFAWSEKHPLDNGQNGYGESKINRFKNPIVKTEGEYKKKAWKADIHFFKFISAIKDTFS